MSRDPTEKTIGQGQRLGRATTVAALKERARVEGSTDLVKVGARILARPDKGMTVPGVRAEAGAMLADLLHAVRSRPRGAVRGEMGAADAMAPDDRRDRRHQSDPPPPRRPPAGDRSRDGDEDRRWDGG